LKQANVVEEQKKQWAADKEKWKKAKEERLAHQEKK